MPANGRRDVIRRLKVKPKVMWTVDAVQMWAKRTKYKSLVGISYGNSHFDDEGIDESVTKDGDLY